MIALFCNGVKGVAALRMSRDLNVGPKSTLVMLHKLREAMGATLGGEELNWTILGIIFAVVFSLWESGLS